MKKHFLWILLVLILFLVSCDVEVTADLYIGDLFDFAKTKVNELSAKGQINFEANSSTEARKEELAKLFKKYFKNVGEMNFVKKQDGTRCVVSVELPVRTSIQDDLLSFYITSNENEVKVSLVFKPEVFNRLNKELDFYRISTNDLNLSIVLTNDTKSNVELDLVGVYVDEDPIPIPTTIVLKPRSRVNIKLSNALRDYVTKGRTDPFLNVRLQ